MFALKSWLVSLVAVCFTGFLLRGILPNGKISETVVTILRLLILSLLIVPVFNMNLNEIDLQHYFNKYESEVLSDTDDTDSIILNHTESTLKKELRNIIDSVYDGEYEIQTKMDILSDNSIHIEQVLIVLFDEPQDRDMLLKLLSEFCPLCEVVFAEEVETEDEKTA